MDNHVDLASIRAQLNACIDQVQQAMASTRVHSTDDAKKMDEFVNTKVNGVNVLDFINTVLAPFAWRISLVDNELRPSKLN